MTRVEPGMTMHNWNDNQLHAPQYSYRPFFLGNADGDPANINYVRMEPHQRAPRHAHAGWTMNVVLAGGCLMGEHPMKSGDVLICEPGIQYGPIVPGPEGVTLLEIFDKVSGLPITWDNPDDPAVLAIVEWQQANMPPMPGDE